MPTMRKSCISTVSYLGLAWGKAGAPYLTPHPSSFIHCTPPPSSHGSPSPQTLSLCLCSQSKCRLAARSWTPRAVGTHCRLFTCSPRS